jgi:excisionase family DNA binding protein
VLTVKEVAEQLGVAMGTVYQLCSSGKLVYPRIGCGRGAIRIELAAVTAFIEAACVQTLEARAGAFRHWRYRTSPVVYTK